MVREPNIRERIERASAALGPPKHGYCTQCAKPRFMKGIGKWCLECVFKHDKRIDARRRPW